MPIYLFRDTQTGDVWEEFMSYSDMKTFLDGNDYIENIIQAPSIVSGVGGIKTDSGFNEVLSKISEAHPSSELASKHTRKSIKQAKTHEAIQKHIKKKSGK